MPSLPPRPPSPRHRGVCVRCSQPPGKGTARVWLSQRGFGRRGWRTRVRRSASPETATGPTETPASCRSVAEVSFANGGFVARTRFGVFGQAMSRYGSHALRRGFLGQQGWNRAPCFTSARSATPPRSLTRSNFRVCRPRQQPRNARPERSTAEARNLSAILTPHGEGRIGGGSRVRRPYNPSGRQPKQGGAVMHEEAIPELTGARCPVTVKPC